LKASFGEENRNHYEPHCECRRDGEVKLSLLIFASGETAMCGRLLFLASGLFGHDGLLFLLVGAAGFGLFL